MGLSLSTQRKIEGKDPLTTCFICGNKAFLVPGHVVCADCHDSKRCLKCKRAKREENKKK